MSYYSNLISVSPAIPPRMLSGLSGWLLKKLLAFETNGDGNLYFYSEELIDYVATFDAEFAGLLRNAADEHPLKQPLAEIASDLDEDDDFDFMAISLEEVLQGIIFESENAIRYFEVEAAAVCGRVEPGQVGGWGSFVTANKISHMDTGSWLASQRKAYEEVR